LNDLLTTGGAGGVGAVLGALGSWFGLKTKIDDIGKNLDEISKSIVGTATCDAKHDGLEKRLEAHGEMLREIRGDIKTIIGSHE